VTAFSILAGSIFQVFKSTSANLTMAPRCRTTLAVETNVSGVVMTSSPGPIFKMSSASSVAAVQEDKARAYLAWAYLANNFSNSLVLGPVPHQPERKVYLANNFSNSLVLGPVPHQPERKVSRTSLISSRNSIGRPKIKKSLRMGVPFSIAGRLLGFIKTSVLMFSCFNAFMTFL